MALLEIDNLAKSFLSPTGETVPILEIQRFSMEAGEQVALCGGSGSGKTTFLHLIAGLQRPTAGKIFFGGHDLFSLSEAARDSIRAQNLGYVFQSFHLLPGYSALENVLLGMTFGPGPDRSHARSLLERLDLGDRLHYRPKQLSVGQQQRVALARALANRPRLILADEPTGNLDRTRASEALRLIREACRDQNASLLLVSHDPAILGDFERRENLEELNRPTSNAEPTPESSSSSSSSSSPPSAQEED